MRGAFWARITGFRDTQGGGNQGQAREEFGQFARNRDELESAVNRLKTILGSHPEDAGLAAESITHHWEIGCEHNQY